MLVEDDPLVREYIEAVLDAAGLRYLSVGCAKAAREAMETAFFPIAILDRTLHDGDGIDLCPEVRRHSRDGYSYVLLFTALDSEDEVARGLAAGADDCVTKRASHGELLLRLTTAARYVRLPRT